MRILFMYKVYTAWCTRWIFSAQMAVPFAIFNRENFVSDGLLNGSKLVENSQMHDEEATKIEPGMPASDENVKDQNMLGWGIYIWSSPILKLLY